MPWNNGRGFYNNQAIGSETTLGDLASMNAKSYGFKGFMTSHSDLGAGGGAPDWRQMESRNITQGSGPMSIASPFRGMQQFRAMRKLKGPEYAQWRKNEGSRMDALGRLTVEGLAPDDPSQPAKRYSSIRGADDRLLSRYSHHAQSAQALSHPPQGSRMRGGPPHPMPPAPPAAPTTAGPPPPQGGSTMRPGTQFTAMFPRSQQRSVIQGPSGMPPTGISMYPNQASSPYTGTDIDNQQAMPWSRKADTGDVSFT